MMKMDSKSQRQNWQSRHPCEHQEEEELAVVEVAAPGMALLHVDLKE